MAITFLEQKEKQRNLILIFIGIVLIMAFIIWQGFFKEEKITPPEEFLGVKKEIKIDFEVLKNPLLEEFQPFVKIKPFQVTPPAEGEMVEELGRENPFIPY